MDMFYRASFFSIVHTMRLIPFDAIKVKGLNSQIFYELYGCKDIVMQVGRHGYE